MVRTIKLRHFLPDSAVRNTNNELAHISKDQSKNTDKYFKRNLIEMLKYFILHTSLHGIKYTRDKKLYNIERIFWASVCITGFCFCSHVIFQLYEGYQSEHMHINIHKINFEINQIPFPSVILCPGSTIDWNKAIQVVNNLTTFNKIYENHTSMLLHVMKEISKLRFLRLNELKIDVGNAYLDSFKDIDLEHLLYSAMPKCEQIFFNCSWNYANKNCCDIFEVQKTGFGFCYAFNSLKSMNHKIKTIDNLLKANNYGIRAGLTFSVKYDNFSYPPDTEENDTALVIIHPPDMYPSKAREIKLRKKYNIDITFSCASASPQVINLENSNDPLCKSENQTYNYKNCLDACEQERIRRMCRCNPTFLFARNDTIICSQPHFYKHFITASYRDCKVTDLNCLTKKRNPEEKGKLEPCRCIIDCQHCYYDDHVTGFDLSENAIFVDVHYEGPTGILYRRDLVITDLDLLVQLGSIFSLFLGGSFITLTEFFYCCVIGSIYSICHFFIELKNKRNRKARSEGLIVINVMQYLENGNHRTIDFTIKLKQ